MWQRIEKSVSTEKAIQDPFTFYYVRSNDWSSSHNFDYWNINFTSAANVDNTATIKTIYDPSVSGFTLPKTAAFTGFTSTGEYSENSMEFNVLGSFNSGWNFYTNGWKSGGTIFFNVLGIRDTESERSTGTGIIVYVSERCNYWSSGSFSTAMGYILHIRSDAVYPHNWSDRSRGFTIRSVKE